jgi:hypothetical protein
MARVFTEGFEMGDSLFFDTFSGSIVTSPKRSGNYAASLTAISLKNISTVSEFYLRAACYFADVDATSQRILWRSDSTVLGHVRLTGQHLAAYVGTSTLAATGSATLQLNTWYLIEVYIKIADSGGRFVVKVDGVSDIDYTGDTKPGTATTVNVIGFTGAGGGLTLGLDDLALNDTTGTTNNSYCGDGKVIALIPTAPGDVTQLTVYSGGVANWTCVDDIPVATSPDDYVEGTITGYYDLYHLADLPWASGITVTNVWVDARILDSVAASGACRLGIKTTQGETWSSTISLVNSTNDYQSPYWASKPSGGSWSVTDLNNLQAGFMVR